jgi:hypothetical protein
MLQEQSPKPQPKDGQSRFDRVMAHKADLARPGSTAHPAQKSEMPKEVERVRRIDGVPRAEKVSPAKVAKSQSSRLTLAMQRLVDDLERGRGALDQLINSSLGGRRFSQADLLALQASMYKYSQEVDLTSKVVEKATNGLKDTLKTQV